MTTWIIIEYCSCFVHYVIEELIKGHDKDLIAVGYFFIALVKYHGCDNWFSVESYPLEPTL